MKHEIAVFIGESILSGFKPIISLFQMKVLNFIITNLKTKTKRKKQINFLHLIERKSAQKGKTKLIDNI